MKRIRRTVSFMLAILLTLCVGVFPLIQSIKAVNSVYKISILSDVSLMGGKSTAPCDVSGISKLYTDAGHNVSLIDRAVLADENQFSTRVCDILIIPTGENFPAEAIGNFKRFVAGGGRVITLGGFAFSRLLDVNGNEVSPYSVDEDGVRHLNDPELLLGANAPTYAQDQAAYDPTQIPIFDEEHYFSYAVSMRPAEDQAVFEGELKLTTDRVINGYSAITTTGNYRGRWQPLIYAYDPVGTRVGTVGAIFHIYSQPRSEGALGMFPTWNAYKSTSIAFFGVTSHDLLSAGNENLRQGFVNLANVLMQDTYIASIENKYDNYKHGETPEFDVYVENGSGDIQSGRLELDIIAEDSSAIVKTLTADYSVAAKSRQTVHLGWDDAVFEDDFYQVNARVVSSDGLVLDRYQTGFSVWNDAVISMGPKYRYQDNYIQIMQPDGSYKNVFATGVDDGANLLINEDQTPLTWKQEFLRRQDTGMHIYECLQQYRHAGDFAHLFATPEAMEKHYRSVDNIVYLSQKYGQIYMMGIAIGDDVSANGANLEKIAEDVTYIANRYASVPGLIYYLNGDLTCHITNEKNKQDFNDFLTQRYGNSSNFNKAWGTFGLDLGSVDIDMKYISNADDPGFIYQGNGWSDVVAYDMNLFRTYLITRWTSRLVQAIHETGQQDKAILCEFYSFPQDFVDIPLALGEMTYSNIGFFQNRENFTQTLAYTDQRYQGKGFGIGETGRRTHPTFLLSADIYKSASYDVSRDFFFTGLISTYAMGGNHYQQWSWNDESKYLFPWGLNFTGDKAPRDLYYWFRNVNFVLKQTEPVYECPEVAIILPDSTRASGNQSPQGGHYASIYALDVLQRTNVGSILTLNESNLIIDPNIKVIYYPLAFTMPQNVFETLKAWVEQGGTLYISGDFTYDPLYRTRDYESRLEQLAGVKTAVFNGEYMINYAGLDDAAFGACDYTNGTVNRSGKPCLELELAGAEALYSDYMGTPVITKYQLGSGTVAYSCDPLEYNADRDAVRDQNVAFYSQILSIAGISTDWVQPEQGSVKLFRQPLSDGGCFYELLSPDGQSATGTLNTAANSYRFDLHEGNADYLWENGNGSLISVFTEGTLYRDGDKLLDNAPYAQVTAMDGMDITMSRRLAVTPQQTGKFSIRSKINWQGNLSVRIGQVEDGKWIDMGQVQFALKNGYIEFSVLPNMVNAIIIVGIRGYVESLGVDGFGRQIADTLVIGGSKGCVTAADHGGVNLLYGGPAQNNGPVVAPNNPVTAEPQTPTDPHNAFAWVFLGICAVLVTGITVATELIKKKLKK